MGPAIGGLVFVAVFASGIHELCYVYVCATGKYVVVPSEE
jgi:hypothetical protein